MLIWEANDGTAMVGFNSPAFLADRHGVPERLRANLHAVEMLAAIAAGTVVTQAAPSELPRDA